MLRVLVSEHAKYGNFIVIACPAPQRFLVIYCLWQDRQTGERRVQRGPLVWIPGPREEGKVPHPDRKSTLDGSDYFFPVHTSGSFADFQLGCAMRFFLVFVSTAQILESIVL